MSADPRLDLALQIARDEADDLREKLEDALFDLKDANQRIAVLEEALKPFARMLTRPGPGISTADIDRARAALCETTKPAT